MGKLSTTKEFFNFLIQRKRYWLIPLVILLLAIGLILVFAQTSALAPFIYTVF